jgi:hypothetical protein
MAKEKALEKKTKAKIIADRKKQKAKIKARAKAKVGCMSVSAWLMCARS